MQGRADHRPWRRCDRQHLRRETLEAHDVTLIGGAAHVEAIQRDGLVMQGQTTGTLRLPAFTAVPAIEPGTLILLTAKVNNNVACVRPIVPHAPGDVTIVCVQNGLYSEDLVKDLVGDRALVLRAITQVGGVLVRPGVVDNTVAGYTLARIARRVAGDRNAASPRPASTAASSPTSRRRCGGRRSSTA
jgi:ketopantoate reductase